MTARSIAGLALAIGFIGFASAASLALFFVVGGPFGLLNDIGNALVGVMSARLALMLARSGTGGSLITTGSAIAGAVLVATGSYMVISGTTGFLLAGLVSGVGFAFIGLWLIALNRSMRSEARWPAGLTTLGLVGGALMALGFIGIPGIPMGIDAFEGAPAWIWIAQVGWLSTFLLYPAWCIWLGRVIATPEAEPAEG